MCNLWHVKESAILNKYRARGGDIVLRLQKFGLVVLWGLRLSYQRHKFFFETDNCKSLTESPNCWTRAECAFFLSCSEGVMTAPLFPRPGTRFQV